jgi:AcrR family transcriptional regulator
MPKIIDDPAAIAVRKGAIVRAKLLAAAAELIPELGWGSVSTRAVAERAGIAPGLVHYHFDSMRDLLAQASIATLAELVQGAAAALDGAELHDGIRGLFESLDAFPGDDPATLLVSEAYLAGSRDSALRDDLGEQLSAFRSALASWLDGHGESDSETKAAAIAALGDGLLLHRALGQPVGGDAVAALALRLLDANGAAR